MNIQEINSLLRNYRQVKEIQITWEPEAEGEYNGLSMIIVLSKDNKFTDVITLKFLEVINLNIDFEGGSWHPTALDLFIHDIKNDQWENMNYKVTDGENERVSLFCRKIEFS